MGIIHKILMLFVAINIIGEVGNVIPWWAVPSMQISLNGVELNGVTSPASLLSTSVGKNTAFIIGSIPLLVVAITYIYTLIALRKKQPQEPLMIIGMSFVNRVIAVFIFALNEAFIFWAIWTVILVIVAYSDWSKIKTQTLAIQK